MNTEPSASGSDIAVVGMACRFPGARNLEEFWRNLRGGVESRTTYTDEELLAAGVAPELLRDPSYVKAGFPLAEMEMFDAGFFGFAPREAAIMDPQHRHFLECCWEALEDAGHVPERFRGAIGVFAGSGHSVYMPYNLLTNPELMASVGFFLARHTGNDKDFLTTRVSYLFDLKGPSVNVQTACSTSLVAIHLACQSLLGGECDMALAGGVTIELPHRRGYLYQEGEILSPDGHCRAFDARSQGTVFGSGVGVVVLRRLADALADADHVHAVIKGSAVNNDGSGKVGYLAPSVDGQAHSIVEALAVGGVDPASIGYVETHGTGTPVGDPIEVTALAQALRQGGADADKVARCALGSVKTNIGHLDTAAGVASFIKVALALQHRELPPSLNYLSPNPDCHFDRTPFYVNAALREWKSEGGPRRAGCSSLGVGGTNAHVVLEEAPAPAASGPSRRRQLLVLSAKTPPALEAATANLADALERRPGVALADVAYTLQEGREAMKHRRALVCENAAEAVAGLRDPLRLATHTAAEGRSVAFMFAGGGAQYPNMGAELYATEKVYRESVDECLALLRSHAGYDVREHLYPPAGREAEAAAQLERPSRSLPSLFVTQLALAKLWTSWGIAPRALIGHSMGEYTAAHLAGVFSLEDALALVALRGRLFERVPEGGMLSAPLPAGELRALMGPELSIAAVNGPSLSVASGPARAIDALEKTLAARDVDSSRVRISIAAHSAMLEPILPEFGAFLGRLTLRAPSLPFASNLTGAWITEAQATDPEYWVRHLRETVRFADGLTELLREPGRILLEVGPGRTLATLARQHPDRTAAQAVLTSLRHPDEAGSDLERVLGTLGRLWTLGQDVDWTGFHAGERRRRVPLPTYPFERQRHWIEPGKPASAATAPSGQDELRKRPDVAQWFYQPSWRRSLPSAAPAAGTGPVLLFRDEAGVGGALASRLRAAGREVIAVSAGGGFARRADDAFVLDPAVPGDYESLLRTLGQEGRLPLDIVHLWSVGEAGPDGARAQDLGFYSLLHLAQALGQEDVSDPLKLLVVSSGVQQVATEPVLEPMKATLLGPVRVIGREFPNVACASVDVVAPARGSWQERLLAEQLEAELGSALADEVVAYRGPDRWTQAFEPAPLAPAPAARRVRDGGVYLVTGGLGGLGLVVAEHLARTARARLVLVGRSGLPPRERWSEWQRERGPEDPVSRKIAKVQAIEALGAEVMVAAADVADASQLRRVVAEARARFGAIHGVVHAAGVLNDGVIQLKTREVAASVLAPKVEGALALDEALRGEPLDFLVLFSSLSSVSGLAGQVDYAAANAFLDAFARARAARDGSFTVAINWSAWQEVGMAAELAQKLGIAEAAPEPEGVPAGHPFVERCLRDTAGERLYATRFGARSHWLLAEHRLRGGEALIPGAGFVEIARAAFELRPEPRALEMRDVTFVSPFVVGPDEQRELRVRIQGSDGASAFTVMSRAADGGWQEHARGRIGYAELPAAEPHSIEAIRSRCGAGQRVFTEQEQPAHLEFGPRWGNVKRIDYGSAEALLTLELPEAFASDLEPHRLHPALLDMATAGAQALIPGFDAREDFFVPVSYGALRMRSALPRRAYSHVRYRGEESSGKDLAVFDVTILDEQGAGVVEVREFAMLRVHDKTRLLSGRERSAPVHEHARPHATANPILLVVLKEGIRPAEGMEALDRILSASGLTQVVVSSQDLHALLVRLRAPQVAPAEAEPRPAARDVGPLEAALAAHDAVREAAAAEVQDASGERRIVAYVVARAGEHVTVSELRRYLRDRLPADLVPHSFVDLDALPRVADGALDRRALPNPFGAAEEAVAPATPMETLIADLWRELLGLQALSVHENFFDVGGHSLLAMRLISRLDRKVGVRLQHADVVVNTLRQLASKCEQLAAEKAPPTAPAPEPKPRGGFLSAVKTALGRS